MADVPAGRGRVATPVVVASANFGGGAEELAAIGPAALTRVDELAGLLRDLSTGTAAADTAVAATLQEMTRVVEPEADYPATLLGLLAADAAGYYLAANSTDRYPLAEKWAGWWTNHGIARMEEGMMACGFAGASLEEPWGECDGGTSAGGCRGLALDLPNVEFATPTNGPGWIRHAVQLPSGQVEPLSVEAIFRPVSYRGNRDTDPRIATVHRVRLGPDSSPAEFLLINVHLGTLRNENQGETKLAPDDELARTIRAPTPEATFLRYLQLDLIARFIDDLYQQLRLPVVVAGDFNATPDAPEFRWFIERAHLVPVFTAEACWRCGSTLDGVGRRTLLADGDRLTFAESRQGSGVGGAVPRGKRISVTELCGNPKCVAPQFTHKRNFRLIDNICVTDSTQTMKARLRYQLDLATDEAGWPRAEIRLEASFSDHLPVWAEVHISEANGRHGKQPSG
jgi:endonuclease/exonuclease/phosphatase family protein